MIRTLIVDDEAPARAKLCRFVAEDPALVLVGQAADGPSAVEAVLALRPSLVFLDVRMPGADGFEVVDAIAETGGRVIFATAHAEHAARAFDVGAADYLLKPFDRERFAQAVGRARESLEALENQGAEVLRALLTALRGDRGGARDPGPLRRLMIRERSRSFLLPVDAIEWVEAEGNHVRVHTRARRDGACQEHRLRGTLKMLEQRLDSGRFVRISRTVLVNLDRVREIHDWSHGDRLLVLEDGTELRLSRRFRDRLEG